jgi:hypothetical protein
LDVSLFQLLLYLFKELTSNIFVFSVLKDDFGAFDRQPGARCGIHGCIHYPTLWWREEREQWYWYCGGGLTFDNDGLLVGHDTHLRRTVTRGSMFYRKKIILQYLVSALYKFFEGVRIVDVLRSHNICSNTLSQLLYDCQALMLSDYESHNLGEDNLIGANPRCHHIQIDESKLGKRKHERGRRVEGVWVLGMVEALIPEDPSKRTYEFTDFITGVTETRYHFEAGNRIFITVPNRTAATLLPIIYEFCESGTVIRSDGWRAYRNLHRPLLANNRATHVDNGELDFDGESNRLFFRAHQVVNHSQGFTTVDQVTNNPEVSLTPVSGHLHTNIIESLWRELKVFIGPRYRNTKDCPGKLVEYLWRYANAKKFNDGMKRCLREVEMVPDGTGSDDSDDGNDIPIMFTAGQDGEDHNAQDRRTRREERMFDRWVSRRRMREEVAGVLSDSDGDNDSHFDRDYIPARRGLSQPIPSEEVPGNVDQQVEVENLRRSTRVPVVSRVRGRVGRPSRPTVTNTRVPTRGRPSRGSRGRGRPRGSASRSSRS